MRLTPRTYRWLLRFYPPYLGAGVRVRSVEPDFSACTVSMPLRWYNRNAVGTHFGGSLYSMVDPHLMFVLMHQLGRDYIVWDQSARIEFVKPGRGWVTAEFRVSKDELAAIVEATNDGTPHRPEWNVEVHDESGDVVARVHKQLYVRRKTQAA